MTDDLVARLRKVPTDTLSQKAADEIERLRADLRAEERGQDNLRRMLAVTEAERDALRADAERYRWLANERNDVDIRIFDWADDAWYSEGSKQMLDAAIDAAIAAGGGSPARPPP